MSKLKILVTGVNGYIGRHVANFLLEEGHEVLGADIRFDGLDPRITQVTSPIFSEDENIFEQMGKPDVCIHLAWRDGFVHNSDAHIVDLPKHYIFIKNMLKGGLKQIAVMGSMHEIGYWEGEIGPDTPTNPKSPYGIAKDALRNITRQLCEENGAAFLWLRGYYILGDDTRNHSIFSKIVQWEEEGKETFPFTSGKNKFDFIQVDELARYIAIASMQSEVTGVIECATGKPVSLADKVNEFLEGHHFKIRPEYGAFPDRPYDSPETWGNVDKITRILANYEAGKNR
jgi:dTDP-6-deoxy-L-talose 4-dehydrogenase (NAD+)